jgi:hypothetical protein
VRDAFMHGFSNAMWVVAAIALVFAVITVIRAPKLSEEPIGSEADV